MNKFDDLTKKFAAGMSRRDVLKAMGLAVIGSMLAPFGGATEAAYDDEDLDIDGMRRFHCPSPAACPPTQCGADCGCGIPVPAFRDGQGWCAQNDLCDNLTPCGSSRACKQALGRGWKCAVGCCDSAVCIRHCGGAVVGDKSAIRAALAQHKGLTFAG